MQLIAASGQTGDCPSYAQKDFYGPYESRQGGGTVCVTSPVLDAMLHCIVISASLKSALRARAGLLLSVGGGVPYRFKRYFCINSVFILMNLSTNILLFRAIVGVQPHLPVHICRPCYDKPRLARIFAKRL